MITAPLVAAFLVCCYSPALAYKATVVEYHSLVDPTSPENTILKNLNEYKEHIGYARSQGVDIVVFPEYGLTGLTDEVERYAIDTDNSKVIRALFASASGNQIYVVVNLLEKVQEGDESTKYYNTNLVFDRTGNITLKYRKINILDSEVKLTRGDANQTLRFETDFGVIFGTFIGNDILFHNPSKRVLEDPLVTAIAYPTAWKNILPFFAESSLQYGYAQSNDVNFLAASFNRPSQGLGGSGVYTSGNAIEIFITDTSSTKRLTQTVPPILNRNEPTCSSLQSYALPGDLARNNVSNFSVASMVPAKSYQHKQVDLTTENSSYEVCDDGFCCNFNISVDTSTVTPEEHYEVIAYDGSTTQNNVQQDLRACSLLACQSDSLDSCGKKRDNITTKFLKITVEGNFEKEEDMIFMPSTLNVYLQPIVQTSYCTSDNGTDSIYIRLKTVEAQDNVVVFGVVGLKTSSASSVQAFGMLFVVVVVFVKILQ